MRTNTESITSLWSGIPAVYEAPTADIVYAAMGPVSTEATTFADKADKVAAALTDFAANIATVKTERDTLRTDAQTFRDEIDGGVWLSLHETKKYEYLAVSASNSQSGSQAGSYQLASGAGMTQSQGLDYLRAQGETVKTSGGVIMILSDWKESSEHVDRNNQLLDRAADLYAKISGFEADCANTINAQRDSCVAEAVPVESWMLKQDAEGTVDLPWGQRSEEDRNCGESIWHGVGTGAKGFAEGLGSLLVGYNPQSGGWWDLNVWGPSLVALGTGFGGLILSTSGVAQIAGLFPGPFQTVMQKANAGSLDMLKGLVAWDEWSKNPGEAFGQTLFNAATIVVPGPKGLGGLLKGTTIGGKIHEFLNIGTKAADDVIAGARDLFRKPKFDHPKIDVPDFKDDIHTDRPGDGNPVHGHDGGGDSGGPVDAGAHETPRGHGGGGIHDGPDVRNDGSSGHDGGHAAGDERGPGGSGGNDGSGLPSGAGLRGHVDAEGNYHAAQGDAVIPTPVYREALARSVHHREASTVMLGRFIEGSEDSYERVAERSKASYFSMDDWHDIQVAYKLSNDDMYDAFNRPFLEDAVANGKTVQFTPDPPVKGSSLEKEWNFMIKLEEAGAYRFFEASKTFAARG